MNFFITGTGTGVGKSIFTALLANSYYEQGKKVAISKPIQTGPEKDTTLLAKFTNNKIPIFNTYSFSLASAPLVSAKNENKKIEVEKIISDIKELEKEFDVVIIEGIGGIAVPIAETRDQRPETKDHKKVYSLNCYLVADLIKDLTYPVIIVARPTLGTINHTVLTINFAKQKELNVLGFVISSYDEKTNDVVIKTAPDVISEITGVKCLMKVPVVTNGLVFSAYK